MWTRTCIVGVAIVAVVVGVVGFAGCAPAGNDVPDDVQDFNPAGVAFGADTPDPAVVAARPQAINPYAANTSAQLPTSFDLSEFMPAIGNQGQLGSCTAWAAGYAAASYTANRQFEWGTDSLSHQASPGYLYGKLLEEDGYQCGSGTSIATAMDLLVQGGCSSFATVGYTDTACIDNAADSDAANFRIGSFNRVVETDRHAIRGELSSGRPVVFGANIYDDFSYHAGSDVYTGSGVLMDQGSVHAAHAMTLVGYDDARGAYRVMNSWSTQWGDDGFMWMAYETFEATTFEAYSIEPSGEREPPDTEDASDERPNGYLDEAYQFADADPETREEVVYLVFYYHFDSPVLVLDVTVTDPDGNQAVQEYNTWYQDGYVYFVQDVAQQWQPGVYTLNFRTTTQGGAEVHYEGDATIEALGSGSGGGGAPDGGSEEGLCNNICMFAHDGECDDGGSGSNYAVCDYGTDCGDCGAREIDGGGGDGPGPVGNQVCSDSCQFAGDGECDDGGPGAMYADCDFGSDCTDCGPRDAGSEPVGGDICTNACRFAFDGECDDGGPGSDYAVCGFGTDCDDCGVRRAGEGGGPGPQPGGQELCTDTCQWAGDGECDDGGVGAMYAECDLGTDCTDCGPRSADDVFAPKSIQRVFRGMPVVTPLGAENLPFAGVKQGVLGANRQPARIIPAPRDKE